MVREKAGYGAEAAPELTAQGRAKRSWWRRKRGWISILILVILVLFGVIFGAVYGVKRSQSDDSERSDRERLFAVQGGTSVLQSSQANPASSTTPLSSILTAASTPTPTDSSSETPFSSTSTSEPSQSSGPILQAQGQVPRDISAAVGAPALLLWDLRSEGKLWRKESEGAWEAYPNRQFLVAPITVTTSDTTQTAISVDAISGRIVYMHFHDGQWEDWQELEFAAQFLRRPTVVSRAQGKIDVINVDNEGHVWLVSYDGSAWSEWTELGADITSEVAATSWDEDRIDVFAKKGDTVLHKYWTSESGWAGEWEDLGDPFSSGSWSSLNDGSTASSPLVVSWRESEGDGVIDVVINAGSSSHKLFKNGAWTDWVGMFASHEGVEFPDTQSIARGDGVDGRPFAHLISRGTDDCIHYNAFNGTGWGSWKFLYCNEREGSGSEVDYPTEFLPTFMIDGGRGNAEMMARDLDGKFLWLEVHGTAADEWSFPASNDNWKDMGQPA